MTSLYHRKQSAMYSTFSQGCSAILQDVHVAESLSHPGEPVKRDQGNEHADRSGSRSDDLDLKFLPIAVQHCGVDVAIEATTLQYSSIVHEDVAAQVAEVEDVGYGLRDINGPRPAGQSIHVSMVGIRWELPQRWHCAEVAM